MNNWEKEFVEKGADLEHDRWLRWQRHMFSKMTCQHKTNEFVHFLLPISLFDRWFREIETPYSDLSESEKESDRKETRNYLPLIKQMFDKEFISKAELREKLEGMKEEEHEPLSEQCNDWNEACTFGAHNELINDIINLLK